MAKIPGVHTQRVEKIVLSNGNGFGSTNTAIRRFSNIKLNTFSNLMTYADSATLGASFTALKKVHVVATYSDITSTGQSVSDFGAGWTLNTIQLTTGSDSLTDGSLVAGGMIRVEASNASMRGGAAAIYSGTLEIGDVLRAQPGIASATITNNDARTLVSVVVTEIPV